MTARFRLWWQQRFRSWWQQIKQHPYATVVVVLLVVVLILFILSAYRFGWDWTGFTNTSKVNYTATISQPSKSLWDWLQLLAVLAIPVVVGIGAAWYTSQQGKVSNRENTDNQRETALQAYIDKMSEILLDKKLREPTEGEELRQIARLRTLTVLRSLDAVRKGSVLQFLQEANLIDKGKLVVDLSGADFIGANLSSINIALKSNVTSSNTELIAGFSIVDLDTTVALVT